MKNLKLIFRLSTRQSQRVKFLEIYLLSFIESIYYLESAVCIFKIITAVIICVVRKRSITGKTLVRSSHRRCSIRKGVLRNFAKFAGKHLCQGLFFNKVTGLRLATLLNKRIWGRCFPVNFAKFLKTPFLQNTSGDCFCPVTVLM